MSAALLGRLCTELGLDAGRAVTAAHSAVPLSSRLPVGELAWSSIMIAGGALASDAWSSPDPGRVAAAYVSDRHLRVAGTAPEAFAPLSGFWRTRDGWVRTHGNYSHHAAALRAGLGLAAGAEVAEVRTTLARMAAVQAADGIRAAGGVCVPVAQEHPSVDAELRRHPLITLSRIGDSRARALPRGDGATPLDGVRVLDLTRVLAGPVATRTLALAGAAVLRVDPPGRPEIAWQHLDTGHGKRSALLDAGADRARLDALVAEADVVVLGYRPSGLARLGLDARTLTARNPQLVVAQLSAWPGADSPRGFDSIVQADCGISWIESADGIHPGALPAQALDHSAGYLLAAGIATALRRRAASGGSWYVRTSLRRIAAELLGLSRSAVTTPAGSNGPDSVRTQDFDVAGMRVTTVAPAVTWPGGPELFAAPRPWGADAPEW
ncbi:CoA transferase [Microbacterium sp. ARD32]|uniref:CoA transferase n=1 Tax=Microbacterium sp. ARD32 TaxID=2962577 RepID=UPI002881FAFE|nr:CoA transferase [Microbacterium sp. ARD32]MDT0158574.1 CoA transferase [Microbacterium sp. ARD32]